MNLLREYIRGLLIEATEDDEDREVGEAEKLITLFLEDSNQISTAQMIPGQEKLVRDMERILIQVRKLIDIGESSASDSDNQPAGAQVEIRRLSDRVINRLDSMIRDYISDPPPDHSILDTKRSAWQYFVIYAAQCWQESGSSPHQRRGGRWVGNCAKVIDNIKAWAGVK